MYDRLMKAYFVDNVNIADFDTLVGIAVEMGLDKEETERMLRSDRYAGMMCAAMNMRHIRRMSQACQPIFLRMDADLRARVRQDKLRK